MIGNWINQLKPYHEDRLLTGKFIAFKFNSKDGACLVATAEPGWAIDSTDLPHRNSLFYPKSFRNKPHNRHPVCIEIQFDSLVRRFGLNRIGRVIRERVLRNKLRRTNCLTQSKTDSLSDSQLVHLPQ